MPSEVFRQPFSLSTSSGFTSSPCAEKGVEVANVDNDETLAVSAVVKPRLGRRKNAVWPPTKVMPGKQHGAGNWPWRHGRCLALSGRATPRPPRLGELWSGPYVNSVN